MEGEIEEVKEEIKDEMEDEMAKVMEIKEGEERSMQHQRRGRV